MEWHETKGFDIQSIAFALPQKSVSFDLSRNDSRTLASTSEAVAADKAPETSHPTPLPPPQLQPQGVR
jgi:hypothetical protein